MKVIQRIVTLMAIAAAALALPGCTTVNQQAQPAVQPQPAPQSSSPAAGAAAAQGAPGGVMTIQAPPPQQQTVIVQAPPAPPPMPMVVKPQPIKITATGHGSVGSYGQHNASQQKLMAMRAAKLDAYRNLAEQVYGFQISGSTTLNAFASQNDVVRSHVDAFVRGAKIVDITAGQDGIYEATVELELPADFRECIVRGTCFPQPERVATGCVGGNCAPMAVVCSGAGCAQPSGGLGGWWNSLWSSKNP